MDVLLVEDDALLARTIASAIERAGDRALVCGTAGAAFGTYEQHRRSIGALVLDIALADGSTAFDILEDRRVRAQAPPALVMTGAAQRDVANRAQLLGAEFVYKPFTTDHLHSFLSRARARGPTLASLSDAQQAIVEHARRGLTRREIALRLGVTENTVKTHTKRLLAETGDASLAALVARIGTAAR